MRLNQSQWTRDCKRYFWVVEGGLPYQREATSMYLNGRGDWMLRGTALEYHAEQD